MQISPGNAAALTHSPTLRRLLYEALAELGLDPTDTYRRAYQGMPVQALLIDGREGHDNAPLFWQALPGLSGDADIGLHLAEVMVPRPLDVVGYLLLASQDLQQALESFVRFQHILSGGFAAVLQPRGERVALVLDLNYRGLASLRQQMECLALLVIKLLASVTDGDFRLLGLEFRHAAPRRLTEHRRLFGLTPQFEQPHDALIFPAALLQRPSRSGHPRLFALLSQEAERELAELAENQLSNRVRYWLTLNLGQRTCTLRACAEGLSLGAGALQRGLAQQGGSFRGLHDEVRRQRALELLGAGQAIREVARRCGFAELSPFYRAFRRWYGHTPQVMRQRDRAMPSCGSGMD
ncbi:MAG: AraC family transcriptional regulator ligand-binding domain-containing protein [Pseudomonas sp.]|uniref:AraC family transcriptional regulator n=1 Tax=Pseudomonas sp. TaxID=306 RepID=UPI00339AFA60